VVLPARIWFSIRWR